MNKILHPVFRQLNVLIVFTTKGITEPETFWNKFKACFRRFQNSSAPGRTQTNGIADLPLRLYLFAKILPDWLCYAIRRLSIFDKLIRFNYLIARKIIITLTVFLALTVLSSCRDSATADFPRVFPIDSYTRTQCPDKKTGYLVEFVMDKDSAAPVRYHSGIWCPDNGDKSSWNFIGYDEKKLKVDEGKYFQGKMHGLWTSWHKNGVKAAENYYDRGNPKGKFINWHDNGAVALTGEYYAGGKPEGKWVYTDNKGRIEKVVNWNKGELMSLQKQ